MKVHNPELISALVDGELHGVRRWLVERHLKGCAICAVEYRRVHHVRELLAANPVAPVMSDSQDFFWSKVKHEIQARDGQTVDAPVPTLSLADWLGQHRYALAGSAAVVLVGLGLLFTVNVDRPVDGATIARVTTAIPETAATTFQSSDGGVTVIWVSGLPWTKDMNEMETLFANLDS